MAELTPAEIAELNAKNLEIEEHRLEIRQKFLALNAEEKKALMENRDLRSDVLTTLHTINDSLEKSSETLQKNVKDSQDLLDVYNQLGHSLRDRRIKSQQLLLVEKNKLALLHQQVKDGTEPLDKAKQKEIKAAERTIDLLEAKIERQKKYSVSVGDSVRAAKELGTSFGKTLAVYQNTSLFNVANMVNFVKSIKGGSGSIIAFGEAILSAGITAFVDSMIGLMFALNESETAFQRTTGASADFAREMTEGYERTRDNTVTIEQNQQAWTALRMTMTDFTMISKSARKEIGDTVATLNNLGVSAETSAKAMQTATVALGMMPREANATLIELEGFAREIGVAPAQLIEQYSTMGGSLAKLGQNGTRAFKDLARVSKITGLEMQKLLTMTDKFDTFEGAAEQAGKLNAALGQNAVNAMDLLMETDPAARFGMIRDSILDAGLSFDTMSYYQQKFYAETLGLKDAGELAAVMRGDMDSLGAGIGKTAQEYEEMAKRAADVASIKEKITALLMKLIPVFMPLIDSLDKTLTGWLGNKAAIKEFQTTIEENMPTIDSLVGGLKMIGNAVMFVVKHWEWLLLGFVAFNVVGPALGAMLTGLALKTFPSLGAALGSAGSAASVGAAGMLAFGASALMVGAGIGLAAYGISKLVDSFGNLKNMSLLDLAGGMLVFAGAILALGGALTVLGNPLALLGAASLAGLSMITPGIEKLASIFTQDDEEAEQARQMESIMASFAAVSPEQFEGATAAFEQMKNSINEINAEQIANLATVSAVLPAMTMVHTMQYSMERQDAARERSQNQGMIQGQQTVRIEMNGDAAKMFVARQSRKAADEDARGHLLGNGGTSTA